MKNESDKLKAIKQLEKKAAEIRLLKQERELRRPIFIEFCGTPKAGKTTTITALNLFLKRNEFTTVILTERASICPVPTKTHPFFNLWTMTSALAEVIKNLTLGKDKIDIVIADRGIFDALCWFEWLNKNPDINNPYLDDSNYKIIKNFILSPLWLNQLDLVYLFKVEPETSLYREYANLLTRKPGSIMNDSTILSFNKSIDSTVKKYHKRFRKVEKINTTSFDPDTVSYNVTSSILDILYNMLVEKIGYLTKTNFISLKNGISNVNLIASDSISYNNRNIVEKEKFIQPIAIAVITNKEKSKVLVVKKSTTRTSKISPEMNKLLLYIGGHVRIEDETTSSNIFKIIENTLHREIQEEIGESITIKNSNSFLIYSNDNERSKRHLAICYVITMDFNSKKIKLSSDEFVMKTGKSKSGHILSISEIVNGNYKFEAWSSYILNHVFNRTVESTYDLFSDE